MTAARITVIALASLLGAFVLACDAEDDSPNPLLSPAPKATKAIHPNPGAQPEAPPADPGPENNAQVVTLKVAWLGERTGDVEVSINGAVQPKFHAPRPTKMGDFYSGVWEHTYNLSGVKTIGFTWFPVGGRMPAQCSIWHEGIVVDHQGVDAGPCAASWSR